MQAYRYFLVLITILALALISGCTEGDPEIEVSPSELDFGTTQTQKQISIKNTGNDERRTKLIRLLFPSIDQECLQVQIVAELTSRQTVETEQSKSLQKNQTHRFFVYPPVAGRPNGEAVHDLSA